MQEAVEMSHFCGLEHEQAPSLVIGLFSDVSFERPNERCDSQLASCYGFPTSHKCESYKSMLGSTTGHSVGSRQVMGSLQV